MKNLKNLILAIALILWGGLGAQVGEVKEFNEDAEAANEQAVELDTTIQTFENTIGNLSSTIGGIFGSKDKKTIVFVFPGVEFGNENLILIAQNIRKMKGVKEVGKRLNNGLVSLEIESKLGSTAMWVKLPSELKSHFKVIKANEKGMMLQYKKEIKPNNQIITQTDRKE